MRLVVCLALDSGDPMRLAPARPQNPTWINGGLRELQELVVAATAAGYESEIRGDFHGPVVAELSAAGVEVATPDQPRRADPADVLCVPDGIRDPTLFIGT